MRQATVYEDKLMKKWKYNLPV